MRKNSLLSFTLLAVLASSAGAASSPSLLAESITLPTCVVNAPRRQLAEQRLDASLEALRAKASTPAVISLDLPALKTQIAHSSMRLAAVRLARS